MKELTSSYDDLEKRMAVYLGLGALLFTSLYLYTQGADLWTYLIRGVLALAVVSIAAWAYGSWLRDLYRKNTEEEELPGNVERQSRDAQAVEGRVVTHAEMPDAVIPAEAMPDTVSDFNMPSFDAPMLPQAAKAVPVAAAGPKKVTAAVAEELGDLPPPPVPPGV